MTRYPLPSKTYAVIMIAAAWLWLSACNNNNHDASKITEVQIDSLKSDTVVQNVDVHMPADNTIAKDSASNREDLGGGSQ